MSEEISVTDPEPTERNDRGSEHMLPDPVRKAIILCTVAVTYVFFAGLWALFALLAYDSSGLVGGAVFGVGSAFIAALGLKRLVTFFD